MHYQLATIETAQGPRAAVVAADRVIEVAGATGRREDESVLGLLQDWRAAEPRLDDLAETAAVAGMPLGAVKFLAPIPRPIAIYCAGANYADHAAEMARQKGEEPPPDPHTLGLRSWHFIKVGHCVTGPGSRVRLPPRSRKVDWEAELAVVIGVTATAVTEEDAMNYVAGYTIANDLSARDLGRRAQLPDSSSFKHDWVAHKCFDGSCPLGPWITLARDIGNPHDLAIELDVNGIVKQKSNSGNMIFNIAEQIADLSAKVTLYPGDVILTGTPAGVGNGRGEFLKSGDVVRVRIDKIGELVTTMV
jgi:2-keto-4-pentenoate hydratase/2-oxohepta-3-ene-1,7-dioic acid hydratase in catechol pathway